MDGEQVYTPQLDITWSHLPQKDQLSLCKQQSVSFPPMDNIHNQVQVGRDQME